MAELAAFVCIHVFNDERPVLYVVHDADGDWTFACGDEHESVAENWKVVGVNHLLDRDPSIHELHDLPRGSDAERDSMNDPWTRSARDIADG